MCSRILSHLISVAPKQASRVCWAEHYCLGAHLAKASMKALTEEMVRRIDWMEPNGERTYLLKFCCWPQNTSREVQTQERMTPWLKQANGEKK